MRGHCKPLQNFHEAAAKRYATAVHLLITNIVPKSWTLNLNFISLTGVIVVPIFSTSKELVQKALVPVIWKCGIMAFQKENMLKIESLPFANI